jgi:signal transduction histidine kinase
VPLIVQDEVIGVLRLDHVDPGHFTQDHAAIALAFANHAAISIHNARLYSLAQQTAALEERRKLAHDLHDSISQALYGIVLGTRSAKALVQQSQADIQEPLDYVLTLAEAAFSEMRGMIFELEPSALASAGLVVALERQVDILRNRHRLQVHADLGEEPDIPLGTKEALYRIAQEAANNAAKHAGAREITLVLDHGPAGTLLLVGDDGKGFELPAAPRPGHYGLQSMQERCKRLGGNLEVDTQPGRGTTVKAWIPRSVPDQED